MRISDWSSDVCSSDLLDGAGCPRLAINRVKAHIGGGGRRMLALSLAEAGRDEAGLDALYERMLAFYADNIAVETHAFDGCLAALDTPAQRGSRIAIAPNKAEPPQPHLPHHARHSSRLPLVSGRHTLGRGHAQPP